MEPRSAQADSGVDDFGRQQGQRFVVDWRRFTRDSKNGAGDGIAKVQSSI